MGERKGVNKYYPPDWTPKMGNLNKYHGTHALRERARKLHEGILIVRFEMPYNIWCNGCGNHIGMGVRYNAHKRKVGNYYTTPIYKFRMKCHLCDQHFEIQTDPKNSDYVILSGARRKEERWDPAVTENVQTTDRDVKEKLISDAMYKLEHDILDKQKAVKVAPTLTRLEEIRDVWKDDYTTNQLLRSKFRNEKKDIHNAQVQDDELKRKGSLPSELVLVPESQEDVTISKKILYGGKVMRPDHVRRSQRQSIRQASIFGQSNDSKLSLAKRLGGITHQKVKKGTSQSSGSHTTQLSGLVKRKTANIWDGEDKDVTAVACQHNGESSHKINQGASASTALNTSKDATSDCLNDEEIVTPDFEEVNTELELNLDTLGGNSEARTSSNASPNLEDNGQETINKGDTEDVESTSSSVLGLLSAYCESDSSDM